MDERQTLVAILNRRKKRLNTSVKALKQILEKKNIKI